MAAPRLLGMLAICLLLPAATAAWVTAQEPAADSRVAMVHKMYAKLSPAVLGLRDPVEVIDGLVHADMGSTALRLADASGDTLWVCLDQTGGIPGQYLTLQPCLDAISPGLKGALYRALLAKHLFVGARYFRDQGANEVTVCGPEESALYALLIRRTIEHPWHQPPGLLQSQMKPADRIRYFEQYMLALLDKRYCGKPRADGEAVDFPK